MRTQDYLDIDDTYRKKTKRSRKLFSKSQKFHIGGVSHNIRNYAPYPFVVRSSSGGHLMDVDGNVYTDYWMGHWSLILGHAPDTIKTAIQEQIDLGWMYGTANEQTLALSSLLNKAVPIAKKIRYTASGTEATMYAVRLARAATGKKIIAKIDGGWHGYATDLLKSVNWPFAESESAGLVGVHKVISIPYNDLDGALCKLKKHQKDLAGIIVEPVLGGAGGIPADSWYLKGLEEFVHKIDSMFILDEIVTGFRLCYGCAYPSLGLNPDIVTLGKIVGGGLPLGVVCGSDDVMSHADTSIHKKKSERCYIGGGTFSANPASMVAGHATLKHLKENNVYKTLNSLGARARKGLAGAFDGTAIDITGVGSVFMTHFLKGALKKVRDATHATVMCDQDMLYRYHMYLMAHDNIFFLPGKMGAVSTAHNKQDIDDLVAASERFARKLSC